MALSASAEKCLSKGWGGRRCRYERVRQLPPGLIVVGDAPYDAEAPLQVVCYFKHRAAGDTALGAAVELDEKLGGVIASLRNRSEFVGDELETFLLSPPEGTIKAKLLLLVGLGDEGGREGVRDVGQ